MDCGASDDVPAAIALGLDHQQSLGYGWLDAFGRHESDAALPSFDPKDLTNDTEIGLRSNTGDGSEYWLRVSSRLLGDVLAVQRAMTITMIGLTG